MALVVLALHHCDGGRRVKANRTSPASSIEAIGDRPVAKPPLTEEGLAPGLDLLGRRGVDHVGVVGGDLLVQALGGMAEQVAMLVHRAALKGHAVPHGCDRLLQPRCAIDNQERAVSERLAEPA